MAEDIKDEIVLNDDELICVLTGNKKKANTKELMLQSIILQMNEEYGFEMSDMKRDYTFCYCFLPLRRISLLYANPELTMI